PVGEEQRDATRVPRVGEHRVEARGPVERIGRLVGIAVELRQPVVVVDLRVVRVGLRGKARAARLPVLLGAGGEGEGEDEQRGHAHREARGARGESETGQGGAGGGSGTMGGRGSHPPGRGGAALYSALVWHSPQGGTGR